VVQDFFTSCKAASPFVTQTTVSKHWSGGKEILIHNKETRSTAETAERKMALHVDKLCETCLFKKLFKQCKPLYI